MHRHPLAKQQRQVTLIGRLMPREDDDVRQVMAQVFHKEHLSCV